RQYTKARGCRAICSTRVRRTKGYSRLQQSGEPLELTTSKPGTNNPAISLDFSEPLMKYIDHQPCGAAEVLKLAEMPVPEPGAGEVLIEVRAAGVNRPDVAQRLGNYPPPPGASPVLGLEVAGRVTKLGPGVTQWREGDERSEERRVGKEW